MQFNKREPKRTCKKQNTVYNSFPGLCINIFKKLQKINNRPFKKEKKKDET